MLKYTTVNIINLKITLDNGESTVIYNTANRQTSILAPTFDNGHSRVSYATGEEWIEIAYQNSVTLPTGGTSSSIIIYDYNSKS